jgi:hypothetical protein
MPERLLIHSVTAVLPASDVASRPFGDKNRTATDKDHDKRRKRGLAIAPSELF